MTLSAGLPAICVIYNNSHWRGHAGLKEDNTQQVAVKLYFPSTSLPSRLCGRHHSSDPRRRAGLAECTVL